MVSSVLAPVQERGRAALERIGLPTRRQEAWRLTDLKRLAAVAALPPSSTSVRRALPAPSEGVLRLVLDGSQPLLEGQVWPQGVSLLNPADLEQVLGQILDHCGCAEAWPVEFNHASSHQLLALRIRGKVPPLELVLSGGDGLVATRVILILDEKADLDLLEVVLAEGVSAHSHVIEVHLGQEAELRHGFLATADGQASLLAHLAVEQAPRSRYAFTSVVTGWSLGRVEPRVVQLEGQAETTLKGLAMTSAEQQLATHTAVRFDGPEGELDQLQKCLASGQSHTIFNGAIDVPRVAQRTNAAQLSRNLLLSGQARVDTKPELEIVADDVRCAHGATVSQLQEDELFYLQSRGIGASDAAALLLRGACQEVIEQLPSLAQAWQPLNRVMESLDR